MTHEIQLGESEAAGGEVGNFTAFDPSTRSSQLQLNRGLSGNTWIVVPLYNEETVVRHAVESLLAIGGRVVIVDDGSTDGGVHQLEGLDVTVLRHSVNNGQGAALRTGFEFVIAQGAEYIATFDADG